MDEYATAPQASIRAERAGEMVEAERPPIVHNELDHLHGSIDTAEELLGMLFDRLRPVLRPDITERLATVDKDQPNLSPVASRVLSQRLRVNDLSSRIRDALDRLEV